MTKDAAFKLLLKEKSSNATITDTATYARMYKQPIPIMKEKVFSMSWVTRGVFLSLAMGCILVLWYAFNQTFLKQDAGVREYVAGTLLGAIILLTLAMSLYTGLGRSKIIITTKGMDINGHHYPWGDIFETYIIDEPGYKTRRYQLVLTLKNGSVVRHPLNIYNNVCGSLAAHIQYFKQRSGE